MYQLFLKCYPLGETPLTNIQQEVYGTRYTFETKCLRDRLHLGPKVPVKV